MPLILDLRLILQDRFFLTSIRSRYQSGEYDDGIEGNSTWSEGDWNSDGEFDSSDFVFAFRTGAFEFANPPLARAAVDGAILDWRLKRRGAWT